MDPGAEESDSTDEILANGGEVAFGVRLKDWREGLLGLSHAKSAFLRSA